MHIVVASLLAIGLTSLTAADQARSGGTAGPPALRACSLLTRELAMKVSGAVNKVVFDLAPDEEPVGKSGSACHYAGITMQIDAFTPEGITRVAEENKEWLPVSGVGDRAYFRNNKNNFAELIGGAGAHTFTIQIGVPFQSTAEAMRPNAIALANAIIPKLQ